MSDLPSFPPAPSSAPPPRGFRFVSITTIVLMVVFTTTLAVGIVFAILYLVSPRGGEGSGNPFVPGDRHDGPYVQKETVHPSTSFGEVIYPIPYASKPHLTLSSSQRKYNITKQSETGFGWDAADLEEDFMPDGAGGRKKRPDVAYEPFTWEAKGIRAGSQDAAGILFEQSGSFRSVIGQTGQVNFPFPYQSPPNVELSGKTNTTTVTECTTTGFKWTNTGKDEFWSTGDVSWQAKGIKAQPK
jgi:hypothetical protein